MKGFDTVPIQKHVSGLRTQPLTGPAVSEHVQRHQVALPPCCPVSGNPREGSTFRLTYIPAGAALEVYSLGQVVDAFRGGFRGRGPYAAERNMEGMIRTLGQMAADALGASVRFRAHLILDAGEVSIVGRAAPQLGLRPDAP